MSKFVKKENIVISTGEYEKDGQTKQEWRNIGEIVTMMGDNGLPYQFVKLWGAGGVVEAKVFAQKDKQPINNMAPPQQRAPQQQQYQQAPQQQFDNEPPF